MVVAGGGAAGYFAAIRCAELLGPGRVILLEKTGKPLAKVRISGGGRCNVTHACFDPRELAARYPRGSKELLGPFQRFQPRDTIAWFQERGVALKVESDGRMFPTTDNSETIIDCLTRAAAAAGVDVRLNCGVESVSRRAEGGFDLTLSDGAALPCDKLLLAAGGARSGNLAPVVAGFGHTIVPPVPSLFTFHIEAPWLKALAGLSVREAEASVEACRLRERGPVLVTHWGLSGPAILRLSAWGARSLHALDYRFTLRMNWLPRLDHAGLTQELGERREQHGMRKILTTPMAPLPARLWQALVSAAGIDPEARWSTLSKAQRLALMDQLHRCDLPVFSKSLNKEEFVTAGGILLKEVNFKTMESRLCPGLHFAGEFLDIDGITGGFNFQAAWTTGWIAGGAMAGSI